MSMSTPLLIGIDGTRAGRGSVALLRDTVAAGILLLSRNIRTPAQTRALIRELQDRLGRRLLFAVDHEGGWVLRFSTGLTAFPGNAALGRSRDPALAGKVGARMARELRALGIGLNLAPVLDVLGERYNPGIGIRSFGSEPRLAGSLGAAFIRSHQAAGVGACAKHFPGKGAATIDAHVSLPTIRLDRRRLSRRHLPPFRSAIAAGVDCVMTSHVVMPALDPSGDMATFSSPIVDGLLRRKLGFRGVTVSDDLCMGAVTERFPVPEAAAAAIEAGHDLVIVSNGSTLQRETCERLSLVEGGRLRTARRRVERLMGRRCRPASGPLPRPDRRLPARIAEAAVETVQRGEASLPLSFPAGKRPEIAVLWPDLREVADRFTFEGGPGAPLRRLRQRLSAWPARLRYLRTPILGPGPSRDLVSRARRADMTLLFCFEALRFPGQRRTLAAAKRLPADRLVALLLRSPLDRMLLGPRVTALTAHGYRDSQIAALLKALR